MRKDEDELEEEKWEDFIELYQLFLTSCRKDGSNLICEVSLYLEVDW